MTKLLLVVGLLLPAVFTSATSDEICRPVATRATLVDLPEASGVAVGSGSSPALYAIADSGPPIVVVLDESGKPIRKVTLAGARKTDWEGLTVARCGNSSCLYVADVGDNRRARSTIALYRVDESAIAGSSTANAEAFELVYPDGPHDSESIFAAGDGELFLVTKERERATIYRVPGPLLSGRRHTLARLVTLELPEMKGPGITDAAVTPDGKWIGIRSNDALWLYGSAMLLGKGAARPAWIDLRELAEPQGEGLAFGPNGIAYVVGEGGSRNRPGTFAALRCTLPSS